MKQKDLNKIIEHHVDKTLNEAFSLGSIFKKPYLERVTEFFMNLNNYRSKFYSFEDDSNDDVWGLCITPGGFGKNLKNNLLDPKNLYLEFHLMHNNKGIRFMSTSRLCDAKDSLWDYNDETMENFSTEKVHKPIAIRDFSKDIPDDMFKKIKEVIITFEELRNDYPSYAEKTSKTRGIEDWMR